MSDKNDKIYTACLVIIGNEILSGRTQDKNLAYLAEFLNGLGVRLREARVIPDVEDTIIHTINEMRLEHDYVFTTGGIGPTHDDITAGCIAKAFGRPLILHPEAHARLKEYYGPEGLTSARARMAHTPEGAELIDNPISRAPGFRVENVYVLAGVPQIMQAMLQSLRHKITGGAPVKSMAVVAKIPESIIAGPLGELQDRFPDSDIGSYPFFRNGEAGTSLVVRCTDETMLNDIVAELSGIVRAQGVEPRIEDPNNPAPATD